MTSLQFFLWRARILPTEAIVGVTQAAHLTAHLPLCRVFKTVVKDLAGPDQPWSPAVLAEPGRTKVSAIGRRYTQSIRNSSAGVPRHASVEHSQIIELR